MPSLLDREDDLLHMEHSCIAAFIGPEQMAVLGPMWAYGEEADNASFRQKFEKGPEHDFE